MLDLTNRNGREKNANAGTFRLHDTRWSITQLFILSRAGCRHGKNYDDQRAGQEVLADPPARAGGKTIRARHGMVFTLSPLPPYRPAPLEE
jgi:hypothetical protein